MVDIVFGLGFFLGGGVNEGTQPKLSAFVYLLTANVICGLINYMPVCFLHFLM